MMAIWPPMPLFLITCVSFRCGPRARAASAERESGRVTVCVPHLCCSQSRGRAVHVLLQLIQHLALRVQLLPDGETHVTQPRNGAAQVVQVGVLTPARTADSK